jgi:hypothetical protein
MKWLGPFTRPRARPPALDRTTDSDHHGFADFNKVEINESMKLALVFLAPILVWTSQNPERRTVQERNDLQWIAKAYRIFPGHIMASRNSTSIRKLVPAESSFVSADSLAE